MFSAKVGWYSLLKVVLNGKHGTTIDSMYGTTRESPTMIIANLFDSP